MSVSMSSPMPGKPPSRQAIKAINGAGFRDIVDERVEQIDQHGFTLEHDLLHHPEELGRAAEAYLRTAFDQLGGRTILPRLSPATWPWEREAWRPGDARANLVKLAAILWALIDRLDSSDPAGGVEVPDAAPTGATASSTGAAS